MASLASSIQFIDTALSCATPFALSYTDPDQKWIIRQHLISLLQDFPSLEPSINTFFHNDGNKANLLNATGDLRVSTFSPSITLTVWVRESYPHMGPVVYVSSNSAHPIQGDHPFVDSSGATTSPYLQTWLYPRSNLLDLVHNLIKLFSHNHPFHYSTTSSLTHPLLPSKREAMDRLTCTLHYDIVALRAKTTDEIEDLSAIQAKMIERVDITTSIILGLEHERMNLKEKVEELTEEGDVLMNWLRLFHKGSGGAILGDDIEEAFEVVDEESRIVRDCLGGDWAIEDLIYALDKAVEEGVISFMVYMRQVRILAREQFFLKARLVKLRDQQILHCPA